MTGDTGRRGDSSNRRRFLKATGALATAGVLAGCSEDGDGSGGGDGGDGGDGSGGGDGGDGSGGGDGGDGSGDGGGSMNTDTPQGVNSFENEAGVSVGETIDDVLELAEEEGSMTIYGTIDREPMQKWIEETRNQYDVSLNISHITGSSEPLWSRWNAEYSSGNVAASIFISGSNVKNAWTADPPHTMEITPEMMPAFGEAPDDYKSEDDGWIAIRQIVGHIHFNSDQVSQDDADDWMDIVTDERWSGQNIGWDPTPNMFLMSWLHETQGREFFEALHEQRPRFVDSHTDLARFAGAGEFPVSFTYTHKMGRFGGELPIDFFRFDKAPASISPAVINNKAPEPNTAILFLNFLASVEGQQFLGQTGEYVPWHPDVEYDAWPPVWPPDGYEAEVILPEKDLEPTRQMWQEVMGDLIG